MATAALRLDSGLSFSLHRGSRGLSVLPGRVNALSCSGEDKTLALAFSSPVLGNRSSLLPLASAVVSEAELEAGGSVDRVGELSQVAGVLGCQWGDEGKGKLVDILAQRFDVVARCQVCLRFHFEFFYFVLGLSLCVYASGIEDVALCCKFIPFVYI